MDQETAVQEQAEFAGYPQQPHGGKLINRVLTGKEQEEAMIRARKLPTIMVDLEAVITLEMIATGVLSPNEGFMNEADYKSVLKKGRLANGTVWPVPLSFAPIGNRNKEIVQTLSIGDEVALADETKDPVAILKIEDIFDYNKEERAFHLFGTTDRDHPGVDSIYRRMGDVSLGGPITLLRRVNWGPFEKLRLEPKDTWRIFYEEKNCVQSLDSLPEPIHFIAVMNISIRMPWKRLRACLSSHSLKWPSGNIREMSSVCSLIEVY